MSDIHDHLTSQMFGIPVSQVTDRERQLARDEIDKSVKEYLKYLERPIGGGFIGSGLW